MNLVVCVLLLYLGSTCHPSLIFSVARPLQFVRTHNLFFVSCSFIPLYHTENHTTPRQPTHTDRQHSQNQPCAADYAPRFQSDYTNDETSVTTPNQLRWMPLDMPEKTTNFIQGISSMGGTGEPTGGEGLGIHLYVANASMDNCAFTNADGDFLIVPQQGTMRVTTEFGVMIVEPTEICVIMRGMRFSIDLVNNDEPLRGYILEL